MIEINALYLNGDVKVYTMPTNQYVDNCKDIIFVSEEEGIFLQIYNVRSNGLKNKIYDSLFNQIASEVVRDNLSIAFA